MSMPSEPVQPPIPDPPYDPDPAPSPPVVPVPPPETQLPAPEHRPEAVSPPSSSSSKTGPIVAGVVALLALAGIGGAWYLGLGPFAADREDGAAQVAAGDGQSPAPDDAAATPAPTAPAATQGGVSRDDLLALGQRIDDLEQHINQLPDADPKAYVQPVARQVEALQGLPDQVQELSDKQDHLETRLSSLEQAVESMRVEIGSLQAGMASAGMGVGAASGSGTGGEEAPVSPESGEGEGEASKEAATEADVQKAIEDFRAGRYGEAKRRFDRLREQKPDDARVWYYSALTTGLVDGDWKGAADRYAKEGLERERAGQPAAAQIDAALDGLTANTGKDWIAAYRRRLE